MNNSFFLEKQWRVWGGTEILKVVTTNERRNKLVSEPRYYKTKMFSENLSAIEMKKKQK